MEMKIGENIKRLRVSKGMTQEQLAELMNLSSAAVSKWESSSTYPDITTLIPLARIFDVSLDELMGYDRTREDAAINTVLEKYHQFRQEGKIQEATSLIAQSRKKYCNDFRIMCCYMWHLVGGKAKTSSDLIKENQEEIMQICDCILENCKDDPIRRDALEMKAKLLCVAEETNAALELLKSHLPSWGENWEMVAARLFAEETSQAHYWHNHNLYRITDLASAFLARAVCNEERIAFEERIVHCEAIGDLLTNICEYSKTKQGVAYSMFALFKYRVFSELADKLIFSALCSDRQSEKMIETLLRIQEKRLIAAGKVTDAVKTDDVLRELILKAYKTEDLLQWCVNWMKTASFEPLNQLREKPEFMALIDRYGNINLKRAEYVE